MSFLLISHSILKQTNGQVAKWKIENGKVEQRSAIHSLVVSGLGYLLEELRYENAHDENIDIARVRHACTELAITMAENSEFVEPIVANWVENLRNDPMIGIKRSTHATYSRCMTSKD